ncbi:MAG TPA: autotransporter outer membrane beta-barrel domain-containing protein, partial [Magnetospirillum sp.]|nr:autotransporter outer membrane beta-barrel domain-containing protein [Magnetospirillum sp.]
GYDVPVGGVTVTPLAALRWLRSETNAYDETGAGNANLSVDSASTTSVTQDLGAKVAWTMPTSLGTLSPEVRLAWVHDYTNAPIATTSSLLGGQATTTTAPRTEPNGVRIGLAGELKEDDLTLRAEYEGELRAQYQSHTALVKAMWAF